MKTKYLIYLFLIVLILIGAFSNRDNGYELVWSDEFNSGTLEDTHFRTEWEWRGVALNTDEAIKIHDGVLDICPFTKDGYHNTGFITTLGKYEFYNGIIEIRVKFNMPQGTWGDLWGANTQMIWSGDTKSFEEIDIFENRGVDKDGHNIHDGVNSNIYFPCYGPNMEYITRRSDGIIDRNFHIFKLRREDGICEFYCDNKSLLKTYDPRPNCGLYLILSVELDDNWAGAPLEKYDGSSAMTVDYIRIYKHK